MRLPCPSDRNGSGGSPSNRDSMIATPLGRHSPVIDAVRALRTKSGRREAGRYAIEGLTMLEEALDAGLEPLAIYATDRGLASLDALVAAGRFRNDRTFLIDGRAMAKVSDLETPPGLLAVLPLVETPLATLLAGGEPAVVLAGVADPGNAGTLLRSAEIFGITRAVFARDAVEPHNPKVVRATMGALFRMTIASADASDLLAAARANGYRIVAATRDGIALGAFRFPERALIAIGNERHGISAWLPTYDDGVTIPQTGRGESLNASVAGGIILYAFSQDVSHKTF